MNQIDHIVVQLLDVIESLVRLVLAGLAAIEIWVRAQLAHLGVPPGISVIILLAVALVLLLWLSFLPSHDHTSSAGDSRR